MTLSSPNMDQLPFPPVPVSCPPPLFYPHRVVHRVCSAVCSAVLLLSCLPSLFFMFTSCAALLLFLSCLPSLFFPHHCPPRVQCCSEWRAGVEDSLISISLSVSFRRRSTPSPSFPVLFVPAYVFHRLQCCTER